MGATVGVAFALSIGAGLATCIGGLIVFFKQCVHLASPKTLAISLSLSAGVMIFISLVEIFGKSVESYQKGLGKLIVIDRNSSGKLGLAYLDREEQGYIHVRLVDMQSSLFVAGFIMVIFVRDPKIKF